MSSVKYGPGATSAYYPMQSAFEKDLINYFNEKCVYTYRVQDNTNRQYPMTYLKGYNALAVIVVHEVEEQFLRDVIVPMVVQLASKYFGEDLHVQVKLHTERNAKPRTRRLYQIGIQRDTPPVTIYFTP